MDFNVVSYIAVPCACWKPLSCNAVLLSALSSVAQELTPSNPIDAINDAFSSHQLVMLGDIHGSVQDQRLLLDLIGSRRFSRLASAIVLEGANAQYQTLVDSYLSGDNVSVEELEPVWRNGLAIGPVPDEPE